MGKAAAPPRPLHPEVFHEHVKKSCIPDEEIKPGSIWVAILHHSKRPSRDVKKDEFVWLKANPVTTLRTLSHFYYERNPIDELALQYKFDVPPAAKSIKDIRPAHARDNLLVLYALDGAWVKDARLREGIRFNEEHRTTVKGNKDMAIQVDDDDDGDDTTTANMPYTRQAARKDEQQSDAGVSEPDYGNGFRSHPVVVDLSLAADDVKQHQPSSQRASVPTPQNDQSSSQTHGQMQYLKESERVHQQPNSTSTSDPLIHPSEIPSWAPDWVFDIKARNTYPCSFNGCKTYLQIQPFTRFDAREWPLCVGHSKGYLRQIGQDKEADAIEEEITRRAHEKDYWDAEGWDQSLSEDIRPHKLYSEDPAVETSDAVAESIADRNLNSDQTMAVAQVDSNQDIDSSVLADMDENGIFRSLDDVTAIEREETEAPDSSQPMEVGPSARQEQSSQQADADQPFFMRSGMAGQEYNLHQDPAAYYTTAIAQHQAAQYGAWDQTPTQQNGSSMLRTSGSSQPPIFSPMETEEMPTPSSSSKHSYEDQDDGKFSKPLSKQPRYARFPSEIAETVDGDEEMEDVYPGLPEDAAAMDDKNDSDYDDDGATDED